MDEFSNWPEIKDRVTLETLDAPIHRHQATIADLTPEEIWLAVRQSVEGEFVPRAVGAMGVSPRSRPGAERE